MVDKYGFASGKRGPAFDQTYNPTTPWGYAGQLNKFSNLHAQSALVGKPPPNELIKATHLCIRAWDNYGKAIKDYDAGKITLDRREACFRVALRIDGFVNRLSAAWHHAFSLVILGKGINE